MPSRTKLDKSDEMIAERRQGTGKMPSDMPKWMSSTCLLYTSDAADEEDSVDLGGRRIVKKKKR